MRAINEERGTAISEPLIEHAAKGYDRLREHRNHIIHGVYGVGHARMLPITGDRPISESFVFTDKPNAHILGYTAKGKNLFILDFISEEAVDEIDRAVRDFRAFMYDLEIWIRWEAKPWEREDAPEPPPPPPLPRKLKKQAYGKQSLAQPHKR